MSNLNQQQFSEVPLHEFANFHSRDYHVPLGHVMGEMESHFSEQAALSKEHNWPLEDYEVHHEDVQHGGPRNYVDHLKKDIAKNGQRTPIDVYVGSPRRGEGFENVIKDGHHRAVAMLELGQKPRVRFIHEDPYAE